jgi:hypothetical protein
MASNKTHEQPYEVIRTENNFEIRHYPSAMLATVTLNAKSYKELGSSGFRKLANYIFGGNEKKEQIAMTAPVHMEINDSISTMSFVMPTNYTSQNLPSPNSKEVIINQTKDEFVAAIRFGGFASDKDIKLYTDKLASALQEKSISYYGNFRFLGYNPPYQIFGRRNEVIVNVNWNPH